VHKVASRSLCFTFDTCTTLDCRALHCIVVKLLLFAGNAFCPLSLDYISGCEKKKKTYYSFELPEMFPVREGMSDTNLF